MSRVFNNAVPKENLVSRIIRGVAKPIAGAADPLSWILFIAFVVVVLLQIPFAFGVFAMNGTTSTYSENSWWILYLAWVLLVVSTINPLIQIHRERGEVPIGMLVSVAVLHLIAFLGISMYVLIDKYPQNPATLTALLAAAAGAVMVGIGWVVQFVSSSRVQRRSHTFNVLTQTRLSKEFQENVRSREKYFPPFRAIDKSDSVYSRKTDYDDHIAKIRATFNERILAQPDQREALERDLAKLMELHGEKYESMQSIKYLLNFYEFLCAGIKSGDLDEAMLHTTLRGIAVTIYQDTEEIRRYIRKVNERAYVNLDEIVGGKWCTENRI